MSRHSEKPLKKRPNVVHMDSSRRRVEYEGRGHVPARVLWIVIFALFILYVGGSAYTLMTRETIAETIIKFGSIDTPIVTDGVIIRDETVYTADTTGVSVYSVAEFERVKRGDTICSVDDEEKVLALEEQLNQVNESILGIQNGRQELSIFETDVKNVNKTIKKAVDNAAFRHESADITQVYLLADKVRSNIEYRNKMLLNESRGDLKSYATHKNLLTEQLADAKQKVKASKSGVFSPYTDRLEQNYTFENMDSLSKEKTLVKSEVKNLIYERNVQAGNPLFRIVHSNDWYIAAYMPSSLIYVWTEGSIRTIYIERDNIFEPFEVRVHKMEKVDSDDAERFVILKCSKYLLDYINERGVRFMVSYGTTEGYKIPKTSIVEQTLLKIPVGCIFLQSGRNAVIKRTLTSNGSVKDEIIEIATTQYAESASSSDENDDKEVDEAFVYVVWDYNRKRLNPSDTLMIKDKMFETYTISEIENVRGVYVTNSGMAVFKAINISDSGSQNSEYVILDPKVNKNISIHDYIVADVKYITENQMVY